MILPPTYRHSASAGNRFREAPDSFVWRYVLGKSETFGARAAIGSAVETAIAWWLPTREPSAESVAAFATNDYDERTSGEVCPERDDIPAIVRQAMEAFGRFGPHLTYQASHRLNAGERFGLRYPVLAYTDFGYEDFTVDMKVTWALPSKPKFDHVAQLGTYWRLTGKAQKLAYITPKKHAVYDVPEEDLERGWRVMLGTWKRIEELDRRCRTPDEALALVPLNPDSFRWTGADMNQVLSTWNL